MSTKRKPNSQKKPQLEPGHTLITEQQHKDGTVTVRVQYRTYSQYAEGMSASIGDAMFGGARNVDARHLAVQQADNIEEGEILTPDATFVVEKWIAQPKELVVLKGRPATMEDLTKLPIYNEKPGTEEARKERARELLRLAQEKAAEAPAEVAAT